MAARRTTRTGPNQQLYTKSVFRMGLEKVHGEKRSIRKPSMHSRSITPKAISNYESAIQTGGLKPEEWLEDIEFFDIASSTSAIGYPRWMPPVADNKYYSEIPRNETLGTGTFGTIKARTGTGITYAKPSGKNTKKKKGESGFNLSSRHRQGGKSGTIQPMTTQLSQNAPREQDIDDTDGFGDRILGIFENSDRKTGLGLVGKFLGAQPTQDKNYKPRRPFFTYWVTIIQIIVFVAAAATYGLAPIGVDKTEQTDEVLMTSLSIERVSYLEEDNMWIGPREEDLIHLGAKFSPCMRVDENVVAALEYDRNIEKETACCIRNDGSGCVQSESYDCPTSINTWYNWTEANPGPDGRLSGSVCGLDPSFCLNPSSSGAYTWVDDFTEWPKCKETANFTVSQDNPHMSCEVIGRPCCIGIQGECIVATREYCDFRKGYFHDDAALCSQVDCMNEICGMTAFLVPEEPDQFYRLFLSQFLHAGVLQLLITVFLQMLIMEDLENIIGWWRMAIIYLLSGVCGSLGSAIFLPYYVEAGPSGSQFGIIACLYTEVLRWQQFDNKCASMAKLTVALFLLFFVGLLPMIDNYAHLVGFVFGYLLGVGLRPYKTLCGKDLNTAMRVVLGGVHIILAFVLFLALIALFYKVPIYECEYCSYFTCIPITSTFCDGMKIEISRNGVPITSQ